MKLSQLASVIFACAIAPSTGSAGFLEGLKNAALEEVQKIEKPSQSKEVNEPVLEKAKMKVLGGGELTDEEKEARLMELKRKISSDARSEFKSKCGVAVSGVKQDAMKLILFDEPKGGKLFKSYRDESLKGKFDIYCDGRIIGKYDSGYAFETDPVIDDSKQKARACEAACRARTPGCSKYSEGTSEFLSNCTTPCHSSCL